MLGTSRHQLQFIVLCQVSSVFPFASVSNFRIIRRTERGWSSLASIKNCRLPSALCNFSRARSVLVVQGSLLQQIRADSLITYQLLPPRPFGFASSSQT